MTAEEFDAVRAVLVANKIVQPTASVGEITSAHEEMLKSPTATEYKAQLEAGGVKVGPNWLTILGYVGGAVALYFIWQHYQKPKQISAHDYPEPEPADRMRRMGKALGSMRHSLSGRSRSIGRCNNRGLGKFGQERSEKYEFEPENRLDGYRGRGRKAKR